MPTPVSLKAAFYPEAHYHLVCKSIDGLLLFYEEGDYKIFNDRFKKFCGDFFDVWSYCLIPNHTHHIIKIKSLEDIVNFIDSLSPENITISMKAFLNEKSNEGFFDNMIARQMNSFLVSYSNYINNKYNRKGGIFQKPFKRIKINDEAHLQQAIIYTHANAQKHGLVSDYKDYSFSSYHETMENHPYFVVGKTVIAFFNGRKNFIGSHERQVEYFYQKNWPDSKLE